MPPRKLLLIAPLALLIAACIPRPDGPIDYVELPETVVLQMEVSGGFLSPANGLPEFTLYGDGTLLIIKDQQELGRIAQANLPKGEIEDLLEFIEETGYFNFAYEQPVVNATDLPTTFLYVNTREGTNAVSVYGLGMGVPEGDEWKQVRDLDRIRARLEEISAELVTEPFVPEAGELSISLVPEGTAADESWIYDGIDIAAVATAGPPITYALSAEQLAELDLEDAAASARWCPVEDEGRVLCVTYRPLLPFEENFPECESPP